ncbi:MAG: alpha/beta hydrolase [Acidobacteria bacterium]|jgi:acetyl esterase/lipase|nr:alpha/beta hydrolase [Acidobacteriota bacterium]
MESTETTPVVRAPYGSDPRQFGELRFPKSGGPFPVVMCIHGGFWRDRRDLSMTSPLCQALLERGLATWNIEYRRVGDPGGGWPHTFEDVRTAYRFLPDLARRYSFDLQRALVLGHSAGGHLALCLAGHEPGLKRAISLGGVVDLKQAAELNLGDGAVADFLGGKAAQVPEHYQEADPMQLKVRAAQWLIHGLKDAVVPSFLSRNYVQEKKLRGEDVHLLEIATAEHNDLIDPHSASWLKVEGTVRHMLGV